MRISYDLDLNRLRELLKKNPDSPLYARYADLLFKKGLVDESLNVIENGIKKYKRYSTAYIVYAKILMSKGRDEEALQNLKKVLSLVPDCQAAIFLVDKILNKQFSSRMKGEYSNSQLDSFLIRKRQIGKNDVEKIMEKLNGANSLVIKADPNFDKTYQPPDEKPEIITETMYHILVNQGLYEKAYEILQKLILKNPQRRDYYENQMKWIKNKLNQ